MNDWSPEKYLTFSSERTQPSIDLVNRIHIDYNPELILDVGCGPGNSSHVLLSRWPGSKLTGIDQSVNMIEKARTDYPRAEWTVADALVFSTEKKFDIVFSNATIQWLPNHKKLLSEFSSWLTSRGVLAFQIPLFQNNILGKIVNNTSNKQRWKEKTAHCSQLFTYNDSAFYYEVLSNAFENVELWETRYIHIMESHQAIIDWIRCTGMKPFLDSLDNETQRNEFTKDVFEQVVEAYHLQRDGKVLFPFERLFAVGIGKK